MANRVLVLYLADLTNAARVHRQVEILSKSYDVTVAALGGRDAVPDMDFMQLTCENPAAIRRKAESAGRIALRLGRAYNRAYWLDTTVQRWRHELRAAPPVDAIVVNNLFGLPLARAVGGRTPIVLDAQEHWTSESASWTMLQRVSMRGAHEWIVDRYVPQTAGVMTVSAGIARAFTERAGVSPRLVTNAPFFRQLAPSRVTEPIRLLHFGVADERRRLEDTIDAVRSLDDRFTLDLILVRDNPYRRRLERLIASDTRIRILPPVRAPDVISVANGYDVGVFLLPAHFPNQVHVLPNKLFDYIQARLALAIGPSPEMAEIVTEWDCGVVSSSFSAADFAKSLGRLTIEEVERMKRNSARAAHELTADKNQEIVLSLLRDAIGGGRSGRPLAR